MCPPGAKRFIERQLKMLDLSGRTVLEVGSADPECWVRNLVMPLLPERYIGVDLVPGPGVDVACPAEELLDRFVPKSFDIVISTEVLEHVRNWRAVVHNLKTVLSENGVLIATTRSPGFEFHGFPLDFWRFTPEDIGQIFADLEVAELERDTDDPPGVFFRARRPPSFAERNLDGYRLYSVVRRRRARTLTKFDVAGAYGLSAGQAFASHVLPQRMRSAIRQAIDRYAGGTDLGSDR
jgi:SAM-dependent methyltransferase